MVSAVKIRIRVLTMYPKKFETSISDRKLVIKWYNEGKSYIEIAQLLGTGKSTIGDIIKKFKNDGILQNKAHSDRPRKLTKREENVIVREIQKDPTISAPKLATLVADSFDKQVHPELCRRILREILRKKPYISKVNKENRPNFAKKYVNKDADFWKRVIFSDESKFNVFGSDG